MKKIKLFLTIVIILLCICFITTGSLSGQNDSSAVKKFIQRSDISGQWFLAYTNDLTENTNAFNLKRGYFTVKTKINQFISVRYTQDITIDKEGTDAGNVEIRLKYLYMKLNPFSSGMLRHTYAEFGMVHRPWLDYEQKINQYRLQGTMFLEDYGIFNSADFGINFSGYFGGVLSSHVQSKIGSHYPGKYGSFSIGIFNGPGYNDTELNNNKTLESRFSIRPFPEVLPGFQLSYANAFGKANISDGNADFNMHTAFLSFEHAYLTVTGQYYTGRGDSFGRYISEGASLKNRGFSFFGEFRIPKTPVAVLGRYDEFEAGNQSFGLSSGWYAGISYRFLKNKLLCYYSRDFLPEGHTDIAEIVLEIAF